MIWSLHRTFPAEYEPTVVSAALSRSHPETEALTQGERMTTRAITVKVIRYELIGFALVILMLWLDEILDLPHHLFGAPATPINPVEGAVETVLIVILGAAVVNATTSLLTRLKNLEGLHVVCPCCKRIQVGDEWIPLDRYVADQTAATVSRCLCPDCASERFGLVTTRGVRPEVNDTQHA